VDTFFFPPGSLFWFPWRSRGLSLSCVFSFFASCVAPWAFVRRFFFRPFFGLLTPICRKIEVFFLVLRVELGRASPNFVCFDSKEGL